MQKHLIIIESTEHNYAAYSPDLPGCIATGKTRTEFEKSMQTTIEMHIEGMLEDQLSIPAPSATAEYVTIAAI